MDSGWLPLIALEMFTYLIWRYRALVHFFSQSQQLTITELLQKIIETDVSYTLIKTSLTDDFSPESSYNVVVSAEGNGGANDFKVVEVSTDPSAPLRPVDQLSSAISEDGRRKTYKEANAQAEAEEEATIAAEKAREAASVTARGVSPRNNNILIVTTSSNQDYALDVEERKLGDWSRQHTYVLPKRFQEFPGEVIGLSFPPSPSTTSVIVFSARF